MRKRVDQPLPDVVITKHTPIVYEAKPRKRVPFGCSAPLVTTVATPPPPPPPPKPRPKTKTLSSKQPSRAHVVQSDLWTDRYGPTSSKQLYGNVTAIQNLREWVGKTRRSPPVAFVSGTPGTGKTSSAHMILREHGYGIVEVNCSDESGYNDIKKVLKRTSTAKHERLGLILEELDGAVRTFAAEEGSGKQPTKPGVCAVIDFLAEHASAIKNPVICLVNSCENKDVRALRDMCFSIRFFPLYKNDMQQCLRAVLARCRVQLSSEKQTLAIELANGDLRKMINAVQMFAQTNTELTPDSSYDQRFESPFTHTEHVLYSPNCDIDAACAGTDDAQLSISMLNQNCIQACRSDVLDYMSFADTSSFEYRVSEDLNEVLYTTILACRVFRKPPPSVEHATPGSRRKSPRVVWPMDRQAKRADEKKGGLLVSSTVDLPDELRDALGKCR